MSSCCSCRGVVAGLAVVGFTVERDMVLVSASLDERGVDLITRHLDRREIWCPLGRVRWGSYARAGALPAPVDLELPEATNSQTRIGPAMCAVVVGCVRSARNP